MSCLLCGHFLSIRRASTMKGTWWETEEDRPDIVSPQPDPDETFDFYRRRVMENLRQKGAYHS